VRTRTKVARAIVVLVGIATILATVLAARWLVKRETNIGSVVILQPKASASPLPSPTAYSTPFETQESPTPAPETNYTGTLDLLIPVAGVRADQLLDTFSDARSEGRTHDAIDIPAAAGTPVLAAADGEIIKLFLSERGGTTVYQLSVDKKLVFYYAHLQGYADGLIEGRYVHRGDVIAYVGDTGNAGPGNYHLHFSIATIAEPKRYWEGSNINPYPLLHR